MERLDDALLISEPPSGELILGDKTLKEIEEEKKKFNKLKLLEYKAEDIVDVEPMAYPK